jgi:hypothetical protein
MAGINRPTPVEPPKDDRDFEFVSIPQKDLIGRSYGDVMINQDAYEPGKTYKVNKVVASELNRMMQNRLGQEMRLFQNLPDQNALKKLAEHSFFALQASAVGTPLGSGAVASAPDIIDRYVSSNANVGFKE